MKLPKLPRLSTPTMIGIVVALAAVAWYVKRRRQGEAQVLVSIPSQNGGPPMMASVPASSVGFREPPGRGKAHGRAPGVAYTMATAYDQQAAPTSAEGVTYYAAPTSEQAALDLIRGAPMSAEGVQALIQGAPTSAEAAQSLIRPVW